MSFNVSSPIKAVRKPRICWWCGERIDVGQPAIRIAGKWDGDFGVCYWHHECDEVFKGLDWKQRENLGVDESFDCGMFKRGTTECR